MPCPFRTQSEDERETGRDAFVKSALAMGGRRALETLATRYGTPSKAGVHPSERDGRGGQFRWLAAAGEDSPPDHHLLLFCDPEFAGSPSDGDRRRVKRAIDAIEAEFGVGPDGIVVTVGYAPAYFERFDRRLPVARPPMLPGPEETIADTAGDGEDPTEVTADGREVLIHLASDHAAHLLAAELALWDEAPTGDHGPRIDLPATLSGVLTCPDSYPDRRTGYGTPTPSAYAGETADLKNVGWSRGVTEAFAGGAVCHVSELRVGDGNRKDGGRARPGSGDRDGGCPVHGGESNHERRLEEHGNAGSGSDCPVEHATSEGPGDGSEMLCLGLTATGRPEPSTHFLGVMNSLETLVETGGRLNVSDDPGGVTPRQTTLRRGNYLLPPAPCRSFPSPGSDRSDASAPHSSGSAGD